MEAAWVCSRLTKLMSTTPTNFVSTATEAQRLVNQSSQFRAIAHATAAGLRVAMPGIVASFDATKQTCTVDIAVYDRVKLNGVVLDKQIPTLLDVPIVIPRGGGFSLTLPVVPGDECLVVFGDMCIDSWHDAGGKNNVQNRTRRHDLSDAFAILGPWSQPRILENYSTVSAQLRSDDGTSKVNVGPGSVLLTAASIQAHDSGVTQTLITEAFLTWFTINVIPFLQSKGYSGPAPPTNALTTVFKAE